MSAPAYSIIRVTDMLLASVGLGPKASRSRNIDAMGEVYGLERLQDFPGTYVRAPEITAGGLWLKNANGVTMHLVSKVGATLIVARDAVVFKLNH
jgi:hypothetical protein